MLLGADLVKPERDLLLAYDDPLGVTAAFNKNVLLRINTELGADIDLGSFVHEARWNAGASRVEMHLVSTRRQVIEIPRARCRVTFDRGESIWTESSYKFEPRGLVQLGARAGLGDGAAVGGRLRRICVDAVPPDVTRGWRPAPPGRPGCRPQRTS